ncbi:MAG: hypothetical protein HLUCCO16_08905 [Phormidium sp. OSCR]|nr:MAG: hypothetical protein HLUCCO16_08905 [Phormidium sp. OSCR]
MDPVTILTWAAVWAAVSIAGYVTITFILLSLDEIVNWFRKNAYVVAGNDLGFTVQRAIASGECNVIQGVFSQDSGQIKKHRVIKASNVDSDLLQAHDYGRKEVAIYT